MPASNGSAHASPPPCQTASAPFPRRSAANFGPTPAWTAPSTIPAGRVFLGTHIAHRTELQRLAADARERGDTAAAELNAAMLDKVTKLMNRCGPNSTSHSTATATSPKKSGHFVPKTKSSAVATSNFEAANPVLEH